MAASHSYALDSLACESVEGGKLTVADCFWGLDIHVTADTSYRFRMTTGGTDSAYVINLGEHRSPKLLGNGLYPRNVRVKIVVCSWVNPRLSLHVKVARMDDVTCVERITLVRYFLPGGYGMGGPIGGSRGWFPTSNESGRDHLLTKRGADRTAESGTESGNYLCCVGSGNDGGCHCHQNDSTKNIVNVFKLHFSFPLVWDCICPLLALAGHGIGGASESLCRLP